MGGIVAEQTGAAFAVCSRMSNVRNTSPALQKDPDEWTTGDEPATPAQRSYLDTLAQDTGERVDDDLTKAEASKKIDELREKSPRVSPD
jgi:DUF3072 family protein